MGLCTNSIGVPLLLAIALSHSLSSLAQTGLDLPKIELQHDKSVRIECGEIHSYCGIALWKLKEAVQKYPKSRQYKVSWLIVIGGTSCSSSARYDRSKHAIYLYVDGGHVDAGPIRKYEKYSGVTDGIIIKVAERYKPQVDMGGNVYAFFNNLTDYGCKREVLPYPGR